MWQRVACPVMGPASVHLAHTHAAPADWPLLPECRHAAARKPIVLISGVNHAQTSDDVMIAGRGDLPATVSYEEATRQAGECTDGSLTMCGWLAAAPNARRASRHWACKPADNDCMLIPPCVLLAPRGGRSRCAARAAPARPALTRSAGHAMQLASVAACAAACVHTQHRLCALPCALQAQPWRPS